MEGPGNKATYILSMQNPVDFIQLFVMLMSKYTNEYPLLPNSPTKYTLNSLNQSTSMSPSMA